MKPILQTLVLCLFFLSSLTVKAQGGVRFGFGPNYDVPLLKGAGEESRVGCYLEFHYKFAETPWSLNTRLNYEVYATNKDNHYTYMRPFQKRALSLVASANYDLVQSGFCRPYVGAGVGLSVDNEGRGVFNEGHVYHPALVPRVGVTFWHHLDCALQYTLAAGHSSRLAVSMGYRF